VRGIKGDEKLSAQSKEDFPRRFSHIKTPDGDERKNKLFKLFCSLTAIPFINPPPVLAGGIKGSTSPFASAEKAQRHFQ
jgi:hypothetical protein